MSLTTICLYGGVYIVFIQLYNFLKVYEFVCFLCRLTVNTRATPMKLALLIYLILSIIHEKDSIFANPNQPFNMFLNDMQLIRQFNSRDLHWRSCKSSDTLALAYFCVAQSQTLQPYVALPRAVYNVINLVWISCVTGLLYGWTLKCKYRQAPWRSLSSQSGFCMIN